MKLMFHKLIVQQKMRTKMETIEKEMKDKTDKHI